MIPKNKILENISGNRFTRILYPLRWLLLIIPLFLIQPGCDGPFPSESKVGVPEDHNEDEGGALHRDEKDDPFGEGNCSDSDCHQPDLRGGMVEYQGRITITPSCYQCHGNNWDDDDDDD